MSYSKVTVDIPVQMMQAKVFQDIKSDMKMNFLPMGRMASDNGIYDSSLIQYRELLAPYNAQMMKWLRNPENAMMFATDPLVAFQKAVNAPDDLIASLKKIEMHPAEGTVPEEKVMSKLQYDISKSVANQLKDVTEGWDIVIGMRQDAVNKGLQYAYDKNLFPHNMEGEYESPLKGYDNIKIKAQLNAPRMEGGTGSNVTVSLTAAGGTLEMDGKRSLKADISGLQIKLTLNLTKIKSPVQPAQGTRYDFMLDIASEKAFVGIEVDHLPVVLAGLKLLVELALTEILRQTFAGKSYKLFSADLKGAGEYSFLIPEEIDYAGQSSSDKLPAIGALLKTPGGSQGVIQLNPELFPASQKDVNAVMALSRDLFLKNVGIKGFTDAFQVDKGNFSYDANNHRVYNTKEFNYYEKVKGYTVKIKSVFLYIEEGELVIELKARVEPSAGIYIDYNVYAPYRAVIQDKDGKQVIHFDQDKNRYKESHEISAEWWVWLIAFLALIIGAVVLTIILAIMNAVAPNIGSDIFADAITDVKWNYIKIAKFKTVELGDCIRIGCNAVFDSNS